MNKFLNAIAAPLYEITLCLTAIILYRIFLWDWSVATIALLAIALFMGVLETNEKRNKCA